MRIYLRRFIVVSKNNYLLTELCFVFPAIHPADTMSDCTTYYSENDPFEYLYSGSSTQYSDPVYEAVIRSDHTQMSASSGEWWLHSVKL